MLLSADETRVTPSRNRFIEMLRYGYGKEVFTTRSSVRLVRMGCRKSHRLHKLGHHHRRKQPVEERSRHHRRRMLEHRHKLEHRRRLAVVVHRNRRRRTYGNHGWRRLREHHHGHQSDRRHVHRRSQHPREQCFRGRLGPPGWPP